MIELEIVNTRNINRIGTYKYYHNTLSIGADISNYLYIPEDDFPEELFEFKVDENKLFVIFPNEQYQFHLNGKLCKISKELKIHDILIFNNTEIKILNFLQEKITTRKEFLNNRVKEVGEQDHALLNFIQELSK